MADRKKARRKVRRRVRKIVKRGKPVPAPSEDSIAPGVAKGLSKRGWEYRNEAWRPGRKRPKVKPRLRGRGDPDWGSPPYKV